MDLSPHERAECFVNQPVPGLKRLPGELRRHEREAIVTTAAASAFVTGVKRGFVFDLD